MSLAQSQRLTCLFFSPTGGTKELALSVGRALAGELGLGAPTSDSFTTPRQRKRDRHFSADDLVVVASPTYAGRVPNKILPDWRRALDGGGARAIALVTFGNRSFDSSLAELVGVLEEAGFCVVGAAAIPTRHAFADIGLEHPTQADDDAIRELVQGAADAVRGLRTLDASAVGLGAVGPYYVPLGLDGAPAKFLRALPVTDSGRCDRCGICVAACPMGTIPAQDPTTAAGVCIKCQACVRLCPKGAKSFTDAAFLSHRAYLERNYRRTAEPFFVTG